MVFWLYGEGWIFFLVKICWFGQDGNNYMDIVDLYVVLQVVFDFDFLFFDVCFMEVVEVVYVLCDCGSYLISLFIEILGLGVFYQIVVFVMFFVENVVLKIVFCYYDYY